MPQLDDITQFLRERLGGEAKVIDTHISRVVIGAERAFKVKRPVSFSYLDFSTQEKRADAARKVVLNRRTAPDLYLGTRAITRDADGRLALDGAGETIETIVEMRAFDQADLFDALAQRGALTVDQLTRLTERVAAFHRAAEIDPRFGGAAGMAHILKIDEPALQSSGLATPQRIAALDAALRARLAELAPLLDARRAAGKVRRCHGDLTLRNICLFEGEPTPFDCIEFDERLATIDVLYDLAFLLMDLTHRGLAAQANLVFNRYLDAADETDGVPALPFFMAVRASIRAHVTATQAKNAQGQLADALRSEAQAYFNLAERLLAPRPALLVAIGGFSGSGKSTLAAALASDLGPAPGAGPVQRPHPQRSVWRRADATLVRGGLRVRGFGGGLCADARASVAHAGARSRGRGGRDLRPIRHGGLDRTGRAEGRDAFRRAMARRRPRRAGAAHSGTQRRPVRRHRRGARPADEAWTRARLVARDRGRRQSRGDHRRSAHCAAAERGQNLRPVEKLPFLSNPTAE